MYSVKDFINRRGRAALKQVRPIGGGKRNKTYCKPQKASLGKPGTGGIRFAG